MTWLEKLLRELDELSNRIYETPEFVRIGDPIWLSLP